MIFSVIVTIITQVSLCKQKTGPPSPLTFHFFPHIFSLTIIFRIWQTLMSPRSLTPAAGSVKSSPCPSDAQALFLVCFCFFRLIHSCRSYSLCQSVPFTLSHNYLFVLAASLLTRISPLLSPELRPQGLWCPVCGAGYSSFGLLSQPTKLRSHWPRGSCRVCNHPA